jgi:hypothetical protein
MRQPSCDVAYLNVMGPEMEFEIILSPGPRHGRPRLNSRFGRKNQVSVQNY